MESNWQVDFSGFPFFVLHTKMRNLKKTLAEWSKKEYGNIFIQIATLEDVIKVKEAQFEIDPNPKNRFELGRVEAELKRFLKLKEDF